MDSTGILEIHQVWLIIHCEVPRSYLKKRILVQYQGGREVSRKA
jgi:hypothetical protein